MMNPMEYKIAEMATTFIRLAEVRVTISDPGKDHSKSFAMALSDEELSSLRNVRRLREHMEQCDDTQLQLARMDYDHAYSTANNISDMIASKIAYSLTRAFIENEI